MQHSTELHITPWPTGHAFSVDCWCEPAYITLCRDKRDGKLVLVVEHNDETHESHDIVLRKRETLDVDVNDQWVTLALNQIDVPPFGAPPVDPNERQL